MGLGQQLNSEISDGRWCASLGIWRLPLKLSSRVAHDIGEGKWLAGRQGISAMWWKSIKEQDFER